MGKKLLGLMSINALGGLNWDVSGLGLWIRWLEHLPSKCSGPYLSSNSRFAQTYIYASGCFTGVLVTVQQTRRGTTDTTALGAFVSGQGTLQQWAMWMSLSCREAVNSPCRKHNFQTCYLFSSRGKTRCWLETHFHLLMHICSSGSPWTSFCVLMAS